MPNLAHHNHNNHDEIGHIHFYHIHPHAVAALKDTLEDPATRQQADDDENCSSAKSVFAYSHAPDQTYKILIPQLIKAFDLVFNLDNGFRSPDLEPRRKPPRSA